MPQAFQEFMRRYEPTQFQKEMISRHHNYLRAVLANKINILDDFLTGSYIKQTQINPATDVDLFIVLDSKYAKNYYPNKAVKLLFDFTKLVQPTYPSSRLKADGQALVITFANGLKMDVVPAFLKEGGGYLIPNAKNNYWIATDPKKYEEFLLRANQLLDGKLKHIIKMIKCWNRTHHNIFKSLHIEIMALNSFYDFNENNCYAFATYQEGLDTFFIKAQNLVMTPLYEPFSRDQVDRYLDSETNKRKILPSLLNKYHSYIVKAVRYEASGNHKIAIGMWRNLFSNYFPSYS